MIPKVYGGEPPNPAPAGYLTKPEVAQFLKVCPRTIDQWQRRKLLPFVKIGRTVRFKTSDIIAHLEKYRVN